MNPSSMTRWISRSLTPGLIARRAASNPLAVALTARAISFNSAGDFTERIVGSSLTCSSIVAPTARSTILRNSARSGDTARVWAANGCRQTRRRRAAMIRWSTNGRMPVRMTVSKPYRARSREPIGSRYPSHASASGFRGRRNRIQRRLGSSALGSNSTIAPGSFVIPVM